jgi:hypothetical protein
MGIPLSIVFACIGTMNPERRVGAPGLQLRAVVRRWTAVAAPLAMRTVPTTAGQAPYLPVWAKSKAHIFYYAQFRCSQNWQVGCVSWCLRTATGIILLLS